MSVRIEKNRALIFSSLLVFIRPEYFNTISWLSSFYNIAIAIVSAILILYYAASIVNKKASTFSMFMIGIEIWIILVSLYRGVSITSPSVRNEIMTIIGLLILIDLFYDNHAYDLINICYWILYLYIIINLITIIAFPNGMYSTAGGQESSTYTANWFLGYKNYPIRFFIPAMLFAEFRAYLKGCYNAHSVCLYLICGLSCLLLDSSTATIGYIVYVVGVLVIRHSKFLRKFINYKLISLAIIAAVILIVVRQEQLGIINLIANSLERDMTFTGRTVIWSSTMDAILKHPIIGYGFLSTERFKMITGSIASHPHNYFLYCLVRGGIIQLAQIISMFIVIGREIFKSQDEKLKRTIIIYLGAMMIMGITETLVNSAILFYPSILLCYKIMRSGRADYIAEE